MTFQDLYTMQTSAECRHSIIIRRVLGSLLTNSKPANNQTWSQGHNPQGQGQGLGLQGQGQGLGFRGQGQGLGLQGQGRCQGQC